MKKLVLLVVPFLVLFACKGVEIKVPDPWTPDPTCEAHAIVNWRHSLILDKIPNPCAAHNLLAKLVKVQALISMSKGDKDKFFKKFDDVVLQARVIVKNQSYDYFRFWFIREISKLNEIVGIVALAVSEVFFVFEGEAGLFYPADQELLLKSLELLEADVNNLKLIMEN